jgi:hypothetical protein
LGIIYCVTTFTLHARTILARLFRKFSSILLVIKNITQVGMWHCVRAIHVLEIHRWIQLEPIPPKTEPTTDRITFAFTETVLVSPLVPPPILLDIWLRGDRHGLFTQPLHRRYTPLPLQLTQVALHMLRIRTCAETLAEGIVVSELILSCLFPTLSFHRSLLPTSNGPCAS